MKTWKVVFYTTDRGSDPVAAYLSELPVTDQVAVTRWLLRLENSGHDLPPNRVKHIEGKIWELRVHAHQGQHRILYGVIGGCAVLFVAFLKKTDETPANDKELAVHRYQDWMRRSSEWRHLCPGT